jgi:glyoxylase-like metal-dependent hydrolase (beta-lactamase superfamily II)
VLTLEDVIPLQLSEWIAPEDHPLHGEVGRMYAFAIRHPAGLILFETGFGRDSPGIDGRFKAVHHPTIEDELAKYGHTAKDVRVIINSHLHFDHCGGNSLFPGAAIYVQRDEYRAAHELDYTVRRWVDFRGADYRQIEGEREIAPGVRIVSTPGHTPGHQSLLVETNSGLIVLAGQAIYCRREFEYIRDKGRTLPQYLTNDEEGYLTSAKRLIGLNSRRVFFSHDGDAVEQE